MLDAEAVGPGAAGVVAAVAVHLAATAAHAGAHLAVPVPIPGWQGAYAAVVLFGAPAVGAGLVLADRPRAGAALVAAAGVAGLAFEGPAHFVVANPDHVANAGGATGVFGATAGLSTASDALLVLAGGAVLGTATTDRGGIYQKS